MVKPIRFLYLIENHKSRYGVLQDFLNGFEKACNNLGIQTKRIQIDKMPQADVVKMMLVDKPDATFGFNVVLDASAYFGMTGVPHVACVTDCATYYSELIDIPEAIPCFVDRDSCRLFAQYGREDAIFLPHAIDEELLLRPIPSTKREFEVVVAGSYFDPDAIRAVWKKHLPTDLIDALEEAAQMSIRSSALPHYIALHQVLRAQPGFEKRVQEEFGLRELSNMLELYIRGVDRLGLVEALTHDFKVHVFSGSDDAPKWKKRFGSRVTLHQELPYNQLFDLFSRSSFVLNSVPTIKQGLHERLLTSLAAGALAVTSDTHYLQSNFLPSQSMILYRFGEWEELIMKMKDAKNAKVGRDEAICADIKDLHTWNVRVEHLKEVLPELLAKIRSSKPGGNEFSSILSRIL